MLDRIARRVQRELDGWTPDFRGALEGRVPAEALDGLMRETGERLHGMLATIPDPGFTAPHMRAFTMSGAIYVALFLSLEARGWSAEQVWEVCDAATRTHFARMTPFEKRIASDGMFGAPMKMLSRWISRRSHRDAGGVGGWIFDFVEREAGFDYGVNYTRCAIRDLAVAHGAAAFAPYICLADIAGSEAFGWGLARTETIAQGGSRCDFRFQRNGETRVRVRLPVVNG